MKRTQALKRAGSLALNVLLYVFIAICLFSVVLTIVSKKDADGAATVFGKQMRVVLTASMEKCDETDVSGFEIKDIPVGSMVFIDTVPSDEDAAEIWYSNLKVGDVLTFKYVYVKQETITHRITEINENPDGGYTIKLEGDNKSYDSETLTQTINTASESTNYIIGEVIGQSYVLGIFVSALKSPLGIVCIVILPSLLIMTLEIIKIARMVGGEKRKRERAERDRQKAELDELRRRLAELEGAKATEISVPPNNS